jgi:hypothetical protein
LPRRRGEKLQSGQTEGPTGLEHLLEVRSNNFRLHVTDVLAMFVLKAFVDPHEHMTASASVAVQGSVKTRSSLDTTVLPHPCAPATKYARSPTVAAPNPWRPSAGCNVFHCPVATL